MPALTWDSVEDIALALAEKYSGEDPTYIRYTDLHKRVTELDGFTDNPMGSTENKLEAIQMAWLEEYKENQAG